MILLDVNILVTAHREDADQHREIKSWLETTLGGPAGVAVSELALSGCLRVITHPKIFKKPTPLAQALDFLEDFRSREEVHLLGPGVGHWEIFIDLCRRGEARGNLVPGAFHAARVCRRRSVVTFLFLALLLATRVRTIPASRRRMMLRAHLLVMRHLLIHGMRAVPGTLVSH